MKKLSITILFLLLAQLVFSQSDIPVALAYQYFRQNEFAKASPIFEKLFKRQGNDAYLEMYIQSLIGENKAAEAEELIKKLVKQNPQNNHYPFTLAYIYIKTDRLPQAQKIYAKLLEKLPKNEFDIRKLASSFHQFQDYDMAITTFLHGRKVLNDPTAFTYDMLALYQIKKDKPNLIKEYLDALATTPKLLPQAQSVLGSVFDDSSDYLNLQTALLRKIQQLPDNEAYTELLIWQYLQQQKYEMALRQLIAFDKRTKSNGHTIYQVAQTFITNKAYISAQKAFEYLLSKGADNDYYVPARILSATVKYELAKQENTNQTTINQLAIDLQQIISDYGLSAKTEFAVQKLAELKAYRLNDINGGIGLLEKAINAPLLSPLATGNLKLQLGDLYLADQQTWDALLLFEQVAKQFENQDIAHQALYKTAMVSFYQGNFKYAKSQADVLKASTSQLIANDALNLSLLIGDNLQSPQDSLPLKLFADADLLQFINRDHEAIIKLDSINVKFPNNGLGDAILMSKSKIYMKQAKYAQAAAVLGQVITHYAGGIWTDDALFTLAHLQETVLNDKEAAKKNYQQLMTNYPGSMFSAEARKRFRNLRDDNLGT